MRNLEHEIRWNDFSWEDPQETTRTIDYVHIAPIEQTIIVLEISFKGILTDVAPKRPYV